MQNIPVHNVSQDVWLSPLSEDPHCGTTVEQVICICAWWGRIESPINIAPSIYTLYTYLYFSFAGHIYCNRLRKGGNRQASVLTPSTARQISGLTPTTQLHQSSIAILTAATPLDEDILVCQRFSEEINSATRLL